MDHGPARGLFLRPKHQPGTATPRGYYGGISTPATERSPTVTKASLTTASTRFVHVRSPLLATDVLVSPVAPSPVWNVASGDASVDRAVRRKTSAAADPETRAAAAALANALFVPVLYNRLEAAMATGVFSERTLPRSVGRDPPVDPLTLDHANRALLYRDEVATARNPYFVVPHDVAYVDVMQLSRPGYERSFRRNVAAVNHGSRLTSLLSHREAARAVAAAGGESQFQRGGDGVARRTSAIGLGARVFDVARVRAVARGDDNLEAFVSLIRSTNVFAMIAGEAATSLRVDVLVGVLRLFPDSVDPLFHHNVARVVEAALASATASDVVAALFDDEAGTGGGGGGSSGLAIGSGGGGIGGLGGSGIDISGAGDGSSGGGAAATRRLEDQYLLAHAFGVLAQIPAETVVPEPDVMAALRLALTPHAADLVFAVLRLHYLSAVSGATPGGAVLTATAAAAGKQALGALVKKRRKHIGNLIAAGVGHRWAPASAVALFVVVFLLGSNLKNVKQALAHRDASLVASARDLAASKLSHVQAAARRLFATLGREPWIWITVAHLAATGDLVADLKVGCARVRVCLNPMVG